MRPRSPDPNLYRLNCPKRQRKPYLVGKFITDLWLFTEVDGCVLGQLAFQKNARGWICSGWFRKDFGGEAQIVGSTGNTALPTQMKALSEALRGVVQVNHTRLEAMDQVAALEHLQDIWGCSVWPAWSSNWALMKGRI